MNNFGGNFSFGKCYREQPQQPSPTPTHQYCTRSKLFILNSCRICHSSVVFWGIHRVAVGIETNTVSSSNRSFLNFKISYFQSNSHSAIGTEAMKMIRKTSLMEMALNNNNDDGDGNNETIVKRSGGILPLNLSVSTRSSDSSGNIWLCATATIVACSDTVSTFLISEMCVWYDDVTTANNLCLPCHRRCCAGTEIGESFNRRTEMAMSAKLNPLENWFRRPCAYMWVTSSNNNIAERRETVFSIRTSFGFSFSFCQMQMWNVFLTFFFSFLFSYSLSEPSSELTVSELYGRMAENSFTKMLNRKRMRIVGREDDWYALRKT